MALHALQGETWRETDLAFFHFLHHPQFPDQLSVGRREFPRVEIFTTYPSHRLSEPRDGLACDRAAPEMQTDCPLRIRVIGHEQFVADDDFQRELFAQLPLETLRVCFTGLALA